MSRLTTRARPRTLPFRRERKKTAVAKNSLSLQRFFSFGESRYCKCTCRQVSAKLSTKIKSRHEYFEGGSDPTDDRQNSAKAERMDL